MSMMFLNDVQDRSHAWRGKVSLSVGLYTLAALLFVTVTPLALSYVAGGIVPMLVLTAYLMPLVPILALIAGGALAVSVIHALLKAPVHQVH